MWTEAQREKYKDNGQRYPSDLTDEEWSLIEPFFADYWTKTANMRAVVNGCFYHDRTGCQWRFLPRTFGPPGTVRWWHDRFQADGTWIKATAPLTRRVRAAHGRAAEPSTGIMDSQSVVAAPQKGERGYDGHKKINGIKRHLLVCSLGFILATLVTPANVHDTKVADMLLERASAAGWHLKRVIADGIYQGPVIEQAAQKHQVDWITTLPPPDAKGFVPVPLRWRIEATNGTMTNRSRFLTRNLTEHPENAENAIQIANCHRLLRDTART